MPHHSIITQILAICAAHQFLGWELRDSAGWALIHRAAAFGHPEHITKLYNMKVIPRNLIPVDNASWSPVQCGWSPIQCAARFGNLLTFQRLIEELRISPYHLLEIRDSRGWNLLHLAAASGAEEMMVHLLSMGLDALALSDPATFLLPDELDYKKLTPRDIALHYGYVQTYDKAMQYVASISFAEQAHSITKEAL